MKAANNFGDRGKIGNRRPKLLTGHGLPAAAGMNRDLKEKGLRHEAAGRVCQDHRMNRDLKKKGLRQLWRREQMRQLGMNRYVKEETATQGG